MVPLTLHEDAGPYSKRKSATIISFSSFFARSGDKLCQYPVASYVKEGPASEAQLHQLWTPILQEFERLARDGIGEWRFILLFCEGDMEVRSNSWGLSQLNSWNPCSECLAHRGAEMPFTDLRADAAWRRTTTLDSAAYFDRARKPLHPLLASSFSWRWMTPLDAMHVCDCNGVTAIVAGSVIRPLVLRDHRLGRSQQQRLDAINARLLAFYNARPNYSRMSHVSLWNLCCT